MFKGVIFLLTLIFFTLIHVQAQPMVTKGTKVLLVMNLGAKDIKAMELFNDQINIGTLNKKYPDHGIYIGLLQGGYEFRENHIIPEEDAVITIYTDQQLFGGDHDFPAEKYPIGREFKMQEEGIRVVSNKKGELILKMK